MIKKVAGWLNIYEDEIQLFLWTVAILFVVRSCGIILNNYAETAFLKRYGVEFMPVVNMVNAIATVFVMGFIAGLMQKLPGPRLLSGTFLFCGLSVTAIRLLIPLGLDFIYPLLFMLKMQYEVLLALMFWNLANDLFNTRQSKRLFPLVMAGGVIGQIIGSFGTPWFAKTLSLDNLLFVYLGLAVCGAVIVHLMGKRFPSLLSPATRPSGKGNGSSMIQEIKRVWPLMKESTLVKIMVLLTFLPNVVIPIINYQFNYAINDQFATESGLVEFFGYFRGVLNVISLIILLFVGKIYGRWGLPVALMFHPFNYILAFMAFLFRFDAVAAIYARMTTQIIRTTINLPANAVLTGLFPESYRAMVRPFLRGTVVRLGLFIGSLFILVSDKLFHPRYLSLVALPFVIAWLATPFFLKRKYAKILTDLVSRNMLDMKSLEAGDIDHMFRDPGLQRQLREDFKARANGDCLWYGQLLHSMKDAELDRLILEKLPAADNATRIALMPMLAGTAGGAAMDVLRPLATESDTALQVAVIQTVSRLYPDTRKNRFPYETFLDNSHPEVRGHAAAALLPADPDRFRPLLTTWILGDDPLLKRTGIIAAGASSDPHFGSSLEAVIETDDTETFRAESLRALQRIAPPELNRIASRFLSNTHAEVRLAALKAFTIQGKEQLKQVIPRLGDSDEGIVRLAKEKIQTAPYQDGKQLIKALATPRRRVREEIFDLIDSLNIKDLDMVRFVRGQVEGAYKYLVELHAARHLPPCPERELLIDHLDHQGRLQMENILRVLGAQDQTGKLRIVSRGLLSNDARQEANSREALDDLLDISITRIINPLLEGMPVDQKIAAGKKYFSLMQFSDGGADLIDHLLAQKNWVTQILALAIAADERVTGVDRERIADLADSDNPHVRHAAGRWAASSAAAKDLKEISMEEQMAISEKILLLKRIDIFAGLSVSELSAIASITEEAEFPAGETVIQEGDPGDSLYLVINGRVSVIKSRDDGSQMELDQIDEGDYFGEMALFEDLKRSASINTITDTRLLFLHKLEFNEMVREYPQIALEICKALGARIRKLHEKMRA